LYRLAAPFNGSKGFYKSNKRRLILSYNRLRRIGILGPVP